jgi:GTP-dependent phosphoenolpyruvate carboxykinase
MAKLLKVDPAEWVEAVTAQGDFLALFGDRVPRPLKDQHERLVKRIEEAITPAELRGHDNTH